MRRAVRHTALLCALLLVSLVANAVRVQVVRSGERAGDPADRRAAIARYGTPRGDILVGGRAVTGSRDTGERLRYERTYTEGPLYAPVTGYASQAYGASGLEAAEDALLSGSDEALRPLWGSRRRGARVATTLDPAAQRAAFRGLAGRRGAVAAVEPGTGRVLALVSTPSYDPGELSGNGAGAARAWRRLNRDARRPMLNRALRGTYPPGSTFKVVTAAAALDAGTVRDLDAPTDSPDPYRLPGTRTRLTNETDGCRDASLRHAFLFSCNTVFARLGARTGLTTMAETARRFGFDGRARGVPLPVAPSTFDTRMDTAQLAMSSIGQFDTRATPLQMASVAAAVADGGLVRTPYLVDGVATADGRPVRTAGRAEPRRAMSAGTAARLRELMTGVVERGTGTGAAVPGVEVGGKTGTAQHGVDNTGAPYAWFIAWAKPRGADRPSVAVAVVVESGKGERGEVSGNRLAAPIARGVMGAVVRGA
ncbi:penicillin-binding transpeptidase domain-containing protein [Streptomyces sp. NPDC050560]|uniref:penicillin-binding transpeptidase domain-containing protein n=1 Tax=Streptomyces sp. NPDC050560 TaxID=3365630 RepID=UPI00379B695F